MNNLLFEVDPLRTKQLRAESPMLLQKGLENNSFVKDYSKNQFYGIYKHPNYQYLEKIVKDDFNTFHPIKFENEKQDQLENDEAAIIKLRGEYDKVPSSFK